MYQICQCYIHFDFHASLEFKSALQKYLLYKGKIYTSKFLHREFLEGKLYFEVQLEEGSLKSRLEILGVIAGAIYASIIGYGEFREAIGYLVNDARAVSESIIQDVRQEPNIEPRSIKRAERRLGMPGKLQRLANNIDYLKNNRENLTPKQQQELTDRISGQYQQVIEELNIEEIPAIVTEARKYEISLDKKADNPQNLNYPYTEDYPLAVVYQEKIYGIKEEEIKLVNEDEIEPFGYLPPPNRLLKN